MNIFETKWFVYNLEVVIFNFIFNTYGGELLSFLYNSTIYDYFQEHELVNDCSIQLGLHVENYHCFFFIFKKTIKETIILCFSLMVFPLLYTCRHFFLFSDIKWILNLDLLQVELVYME